MPVKVYIIESERGWGQRVDEVKEFVSLSEAKRFVAGFNAKNKALKPGESVPDWYMYARIEDNSFGQLNG